jgi:hypothetical protein
MARFSYVVAFAAACIFPTSGCLLQEHGECGEGSNPKEHACLARIYEPVFTGDDSGMGGPSCGAPSIVGGTSGNVREGLSRSRGSCGGGGAENQFIYTASWSGPHTFETTDASFDTVLYVLRGECGGPEIGCDDDGGDGTQSRVTVDLRASERVTVVVDAYGSTGGGTYILRVDAP